MKVNFVLGSICGPMQAVIIFVCCFYPWWFSCMVPQGGWGLLAGAECSIVNESIPLIYMAVPECTRVHLSTMHFLWFPSPFPTACAYWSGCHWAVPRSLPWGVTVNTGCSYRWGQFKLSFLFYVTFYLLTELIYYAVGVLSLIRDLRRVVLFCSLK